MILSRRHRLLWPYPYIKVKMNILKYSIHYNSVNRKDTNKKKKKEKIPVWKGKVRLHDFFFMNIRKSVCYCNESIYCF